MDFIPTPEIVDNLIIDLSLAIVSSSFDYLSFLDSMEDNQDTHHETKKNK